MDKEEFEKKKSRLEYPQFTGKSQHSKNIEKKNIKLKVITDII
ncbi:hypothetical protein LCGC14_1270650 [marine sediment metagenome]|uniref:Uncharacterized protein n=1 Tax=marine sediment metagenome TaxID=412755 RepID=A0A0F9LJ71_9ZZZZ